MPKGVSGGIRATSLVNKALLMKKGWTLHDDQRSLFSKVFNFMVPSALYAGHDHIKGAVFLGVPKA